MGDYPPVRWGVRSLGFGFVVGVVEACRATFEASWTFTGEAVHERPTCKREICLTLWRDRWGATRVSNETDSAGTGSRSVVWCEPFAIEQAGQVGAVGRSTFQPVVVDLPGAHLLDPDLDGGGGRPDDGRPEASVGLRAYQA